MRDNTYTIVMVGPPAIGKSKAIRRLTGKHIPRQYEPTVGAEYYTATILLKDERVIDLEIWDVAGNDQLSGDRSELYQKADGVIVLYRDKVSVNSYLREINNAVDKELHMKTFITHIDDINTHRRFYRCLRFVSTNVASN